jgi:hypothetical protein
MDQPYNVVADWLSKFHPWPETIQALWLVAVPATLLGVTWIVMRGLRDTVAAWRGRGEGRLVHGVVEDARGQQLLYRDGEARAVETGPPLLPPSPSSSDLFRGSTP